MLQHFKKDSNGQKTASELYADLKFLNLLMLFKWFLRSRKHCMCSVAFQQLVVALRDHFSALRRIKNYVRNGIGQERLNNVSVLNIERLYANEVLKYDLDSVMDASGRLSDRRTKLLF